MQQGPFQLVVRSMMRALALALAALTPLLGSEAAAQSIPVIPPDYAATASRYAEGDRAGAMALLGGWPERRLKKHLDFLGDSVVSIRKCPACPTRVEFNRFPLRAALLLHADLEIQEQFSPPVSEQLAQCGMGQHAIAIEHLAAILQLLDPEAGAFLKPLYLAIAHQAQWSHCFDQ
jgi:hypothetical protein